MSVSKFNPEYVNTSIFKCIISLSYMENVHEKACIITAQMGSGFRAKN